MKPLLKFFISVVVLLLATGLTFSQKTLNSISNQAPTKAEILNAIHGPTAIVANQAKDSIAVGDDCSSPILVNTFPFSDVGQTTCGRVNDYDATCLNDFDGGEDIVYQIDLVDPTTLYFLLDPKGTKNTGIALSEVCPGETVCLYTSADFDGVPHGFTATLAAGTYFLMVDTWPNPTCIPVFDLFITVPSGAPVNDDCFSALPVSEVSDLPFNTDLATFDGWCYDSPNIWYLYTATQAGNATVSLCGSFFDTYLAVHATSDCNQTFCGNYVNDDYCNIASQVTFPVNPGDQFLVEIKGFEGATGEGLLNIFVTPTCTLAKEPNDLDEAETCGDDINGGCNMLAPAFTEVADGDTVFGNVWAFNGIRDTDWFHITTTQISTIRMTLASENIMIFGMVGQQTQGLPGCQNMTYEMVSPVINNYCDTSFVEYYGLPAGDYFFFAAPDEFDGAPCPGYNYRTSFKVTPNPVEYIYGNVSSTSLTPIEGAVVFADVYYGTTDINGDYVIEVLIDTVAGYSTYDVNVDAHCYEDMTIPGVVVLENTSTYDIDFLLDELPSPTIVSAVPGIENVTLTWTDAAKSPQNSDQINGYMISTNTYNPGTTMDLTFSLVVFSPDWEYGDYCEIVFPVGITPNGGTDLNSIPATINGQTIYWDGTFYYGYTNAGPVALFDITVNVTVDPGMTGVQPADYYVEGDQWGGYQHQFSGIANVFETGMYVPHFNIFRKKTGAANYVLVQPNYVGNVYIDEVYPGGEEYCYQVVQILPDGQESCESNTMCATPVFRPGSSCEQAIDYGMVDSPALINGLVRPGDARWYRFTVPYGMDVIISVCRPGAVTNFNTRLALFDDCSDFVDLPQSGAPINALYYNNNTDYCVNNNDLSQINAKYLPAGEYYAVVYGNANSFGDFTIFIQQHQIINLPNLWSGMSTYMFSETPSVVDVMNRATNPVNLVIMVGLGSVYWPSENINTLGNVVTTTGYKLKMNSAKDLVVYGAVNNNKVVSMNSGLNYMPVRSFIPTASSPVLDQLGTKLLISYDIKTLEVYWPGGSLYTLGTLIPGVGYATVLTSAGSVTYPNPVSDVKVPEAFAAQFLNGIVPVWNDVVTTDNVHFISVSETALAKVKAGDYLGVFNAEGLCVGNSMVTDQKGNLLLAAYGDDVTTQILDGMLEEQEMIIKLYRPETGEQFETEITYSTVMPNFDGTFRSLGMSMITDITLKATGVNENLLSNIRIYPNPTNGVLMINGVQGNVDMVVTNAQGQLLFNGLIHGQMELDMTHNPKGIYFIRLTGDNSTRVEKVVVK